MGELNPGIERTVAWLNENGFETCDSGDGNTHDYACDRDHAYVVIKVVPPQDGYNEMHRLVKLLSDSGVDLRPLDELGTVPNLQLVLDPTWDYAFLDLTNVDDALLFDRS